MEAVFGEMLGITCPDGFFKMDEADLEKITVFGDGTCGGLRDPERHILITVGWKAVRRFAALILTTKDLAKNTRTEIGKAMQPFGFRDTGTLSKDIGGRAALGFSYEYEAEGIPMYAESYALKHGTTFFYLHFYARDEQKSESLDLWNTILSSARWIS